MGVKTEISIAVDSNVAATTTDVGTVGPIIPLGVKVIIRVFGGFAKDGFAALQWGSGASWTTIRVIGMGSAEYAVNKQFVGDGAKRFRLVRRNNEATAQPVAAWIEAFQHDAAP